MVEIREPLRDKTQTGDTMYGLVERYAGDLDLIEIDGRPASALPLDTWFDFVRKIPYRKDKRPVEVISRPLHIVTNRHLGMDCKKKAIALASWAKVNRVPYRFVASSRRPDRKLHHVFPQINLSGTWDNYDATYRHYQPRQSKTVTAAEVL